jgi:hypothetical protein
MKYLSLALSSVKRKDILRGYKIDQFDLPGYLSFIGDIVLRRLIHCPLRMFENNFIHEKAFPSFHVGGTMKG